MAGDHQKSSMSRFRAKFLRRSSSSSTSPLPTQQQQQTTSSTSTTTPTSNPASPSASNTLTSSTSSSPQQQRPPRRRHQSHRLSFVSSLFGSDPADDKSTDVETVKPDRPENTEAASETNDESNNTLRQPENLPIQAEAAETEAPQTAPEAQASSQPELERRSPKEDSADSIANNNQSADRVPILTSPTYATRSSTPVLDAVGESVPSPSGSVPSRHPSVLRRPSLAIRRQSLVPSSQHRLIRTLLDQPSAQNQTGDYFSPPNNAPSIQPDMVHRKVWVKRLGSSATLVPVTEEDLVDDLRDVILRKYTNSLGKSFDAPDLILRLIPREQSNRQTTDRLLGPEEPVGRTLDAYYPGGQTINEALIIEILSRRTPKPSPRQNMTYSEEVRPAEAGDYFSPMPTSMSTPPHIPSTVSSASGHNPHVTHIPSMSVLTTGQVPPIPSPGSRGSWNQQQQQHHQHQQQQHRPKYHRQHTTSPTIITTSPSNLNVEPNPSINGVTSGAAPMPSPPAPVPDQASQKSSATPPARVASPRPSAKPRKAKKSNGVSSPPALPSGLLDGTVPPINVLIVEDNIINLKLLEAFMKRLKVRWQTAMNGREAVNKWRTGGFHLVLMDIQLPVMNGLDATKEIRRLERLNNIGVFPKNCFGLSSTVGSNDGSDSPPEMDMEPKPEDTLENLFLFKSPIIIVALTASSLQSDRHEALAAGCNDFLTKPVNFVWLEQKVTEWGCMQALIDFEGWRKWRGFADQANQSVNTDSHEAEAANDRVIEKMGVDRLGDSALAQRRAATSTSSRANLTSDDYVGPGPVNVKSAVPASLTTPSGQTGTTGKSSSTNSTSTVVAGGRSPAASNGSGFRESRRGSVPIVVPGRK